ncbi:MAG: hypothetical protein FJY73_01005 [Candidatus Eisenbacteria bacterium]|nr:hypothetical protein [Candidatus Eisenbacteria bacterium]
MPKKKTGTVTETSTPKESGKPKRPRTTPTSGGKKGAAWTFPKETLESAIRVPRAIDEKHGGNPMNAADLAKAVGFHQSNDWRFLDLLRAANQYGLVSGSGAHATVRLEKLGQDIVAPEDASDRQRALLEAFRKVEDFKKVEEFYGSKPLPEDEFFKNTLSRQFSVPRDRVDRFAEVFRENLAFLMSFAARPPKTPPREKPSGTGEEALPEPPEPLKEDRVRRFLDSCFVMMPFGEWFDKYYQQIYVPAIRAAGFEPVRADELFNTGTVVEQIWEQIGKSTVLLADLTGKNANVFYELGLAHAARKPVVFAAGQIDDIPFDLRHLRVIVYDVREPQWAATLSRQVTEFLKNAKADPAKSIPQPFRGDQE